MLTGASDGQAGSIKRKQRVGTRGVDASKQASKQHPWDHLRQWEGKINREDETYHNNAHVSKSSEMFYFRCLYTVTIRDKVGIKLQTRFLPCIMKMDTFILPWVSAAHSRNWRQSGHTTVNTSSFSSSSTVDTSTRYTAAPRRFTMKNIHTGNILSFETYTAAVGGR